MNGSPSDWLARSSAVMEFIRRADLICVPERDVWLYKANALDQLAAFLQNQGEDQQHRELLGDTDPD